MLRARDRFMHAVAFAFKRAHLRTTDISRRCVRRFGLTPARYDMLYAIMKCHARRQRDLWKMFDVSRATVSRMLIALEKLGLVRRSRTSGVPSREVELTPEGRDLMEEAIRGCHRPLCLLFESLYPRVRGRLDRAWNVAKLHGRVSVVAEAFGDQSRFTYPYNDPEDVYPFVPDPHAEFWAELGAAQARREVA